MSSADKPKNPDKQRWEPTVGVKFNNPFIDGPPRFNIEQDVIKAIRNTPKDAKIKISVYSFDRRNVAETLLAAHRRGVEIQILLNDHQVTKEQKMLKAALGASPRRKTFSYECQAACRGRRDNLHSKFFLFSRTGGVDNVIMLGSANFTLNAAKWQWNDMLTLNDQPDLFKNFVLLFNDMRKDWARNRPYYYFCNQPLDEPCRANQDDKLNRVFPRAASPRDDVAMNIMKPIQCVYSTEQGDKQRTIVRLSMHTMQGDRGKWIATRLRQLWAEGCDIKVIYGLMGSGVKGRLGAPTPRGRIPMRSTGFSYDDDPLDVERYTHQKYFVVRGMYGGTVLNRSWTGSSNWSSRGTYGDEIMFNIDGKRFVNAYLKNFALMFNSGRYSRNAYTTTKEDYRAPATRTDARGRPFTTFVTRQRVTTEVRPDRLIPGDTWEAD